MRGRPRILVFLTTVLSLGLLPIQAQGRVAGLKIDQPNNDLILTNWTSGARPTLFNDSRILVYRKSSCHGVLLAKLVAPETLKKPCTGGRPRPPRAFCPKSLSSEENCLCLIPQSNYCAI